MYRVDRLGPTRRPAGAPQGFQRWHQLLFSHWEVPEQLLRPLVPKRLELDAFDGRYYVGVVAFTMQNVRPWRWAPGVPSATQFGEINLRTYVHLAGGEPGVYFFSLDAASALVVWAARTFWGLPYFHADVKIEAAPTRIEYRALRRQPRLEFSAQATLGRPLPVSSLDSLQYFLCERYQFYTERRGKLQRARVHHAPYELVAVEQATVDTTLLRAAGLPEVGLLNQGEQVPHLFSPGVDVDVFALEDVTI